MITQPETVPEEIKQAGDWLVLGLGALLAGVALGWWVKNK